MSRIAIVGGGVAGLSIAHALGRLGAAERGIEIRLLERGARCGGNVRSELREGFLCEWGPNGFLDNVPTTLALVRELGLAGELRPSEEQARKRFIFRNGRLHELPAGPFGFLASGLVSWRAKLRIGLEPLARPRPEHDETIHEFATRRIGREAADVLIDSMVSGVFAGDARQLSLRACFPKMWQLETDHGGLFRALLARRKSHPARKGEAMGQPRGTLTSFRRGTEQLITGLVGALGSSVRTGAEVRAVERAGERYRLRLGDGSALDADAVVLAGGAQPSSRMVAALDPPLGELLGSIPTAPLAVVCLGYRSARLPSPLDGFGFLVPRGQGPRVLGVLWDSSMYPERAPADHVLVRVMAGGAHDPDAVALDDAELCATVRADLRTTMGLDLEPDFAYLVRHPTGIPQYTVGHLERLAQAEARLAGLPGLMLAGNSYRGVAINACVAEAGGIAQRLVDLLASGAAATEQPT